MDQLFFHGGSSYGESLVVKDILEIVGTEVSLLATGNFLDDRIFKLKKTAFKKQEFEEDLSQQDK